MTAQLPTSNTVSVLWHHPLGADLAEPVKTAWTEVYATLAGVMKSAGATMSPQAVG